MKYRVNENERGVDISVEGVENNKEKLLKAFQECQDGHCSCPTDEYKKLESLDIEHDENNIHLHLKAKQGLRINKSELDKCLDYTSRRVESENV